MEADETYVLVSANGSRKLIGRAAKKPCGAASKPGLFDQHVAVLIACDRHEATVADVLFDRREASEPLRLAAK